MLRSAALALRYLVGGENERQTKGGGREQSWACGMAGEAYGGRVTPATPTKKSNVVDRHGVLCVPDAFLPMRRCVNHTLALAGSRGPFGTWCHQPAWRIRGLADG